MEKEYWQWEAEIEDIVQCMQNTIEAIVAGELKGRPGRPPIDLVISHHFSRLRKVIFDFKERSLSEETKREIKEQRYTHLINKVGGIFEKVIWEDNKGIPCKIQQTNSSDILIVGTQQNSMFLSRSMVIDLIKLMAIWVERGGFE